MRKVMILISLMFVLVLSCSMGIKQEAGKGTLKFIYEKEGQASRSVASDARGIIVTIEDMAGVKLYDMEYLSLFSLNGYLITGPIDLPAGDYRLTQFLVLNSNSEVIGATPMEGSPLALSVNDPLPIDFHINKDEVLKLIPEVISTEELIPEDFGYVTFSFTEVTLFPFLTAAFIYDYGIQNFALTDANLRIIADGNIVYDWPLAPVTNTIAIPAGYLDYTLVVEKPGYLTYTETFTAAELAAYWSTVLEVILWEDYNFTIKYNNGLDDVYIRANELVTGSSITDFYSYGTPAAASYNGTEILSESDTIMMFILQDGGGDNHLVVYWDTPNDGSGGNLGVDINSTGLSGEVLGFPVEDDPGETTYVWDSVTGSASLNFGWAPCCTDGFVLGVLPPGINYTLDVDYSSINGLSVMKIPYLDIFDNLQVINIPFSQINTVEFIY